MIGRIYKIITPNSKKIYVGSTFKELPERLKKHIHNFNYYKKTGKGKVSSYKLIKLGGCKIKLLEEVVTDIVKELRKIEERWIIKFKDKGVNKYKARRTVKEQKKYAKEYYATRFECECGCMISNGTKGYHLKSKKHEKAMNNK